MPNIDSYEVICTESEVMKKIGEICDKYSVPMSVSEDGDVSIAGDIQTIQGDIRNGDNLAGFELELMELTQHNKGVEILMSVTFDHDHHVVKHRSTICDGKVMGREMEPNYSLMQISGVSESVQDKAYQKAIDDVFYSMDEQALNSDKPMPDGILKYGFELDGFKFVVIKRGLHLSLEAYKPKVTEWEPVNHFVSPLDELLF